MMDNFRELAETQLQCAVCSEVFVEATAINCGHTFCHFCIHEWKKKKSNCPVCRTDIKQIVAVKVGPLKHQRRAIISENNPKEFLFNLSFKKSLSLCS